MPSCAEIHETYGTGATCLQDQAQLIGVTAFSEKLELVMDARRRIPERETKRVTRIKDRISDLQTAA